MAGGFEQADNGPRSLGRGGAAAASVRDATALYYNPAALSRVRSYSVVAGLNLMDAQVRFERAPYEYYNGAVETDASRRQINFDPVEDEVGFYPAPMLFAAGRFGLERWVFAMGAYGPASAGRAQYPGMEVRPDNYSGEVIGVYEPGRNQPITRNGGQAYQLVYQDVLLAYPSLSASYEIPSANLSFGLTAQLATLFVEYDVGIDGIFGEGSVTAQSRESDALYSGTVLNVKGFAPTGIVGVFYEPHERVALSLSYRPRFNISGRGDIDVTYPDGLISQNPQLDDTGAKLSLTLPDVVRFGVAYSHPSNGDFPLFDVELNAVYEGWHVTDGFEIELDGRLSDDAGAVQNQKLPDLFMGRYYNDTVSFRLGSDLNFLRNERTNNGPVFRLGSFFETNGSPEEWTALDFTPFQRLAGTVGFGYHFGEFAIDAAYAFTGSPSRNVTDGEYELQTPLWICNDPPSQDLADRCGALTETPGHVVNNGRYEVNYHTISVGLSWNR